MRISIIGSGKVATHLAIRLLEKGVLIHQVYSRNLEHARVLAEKVNASPVSDFNEIDKGKDLYIIAVSDDAIEQVAANLSKALAPQNALVVHTSGATPGKVLEPYFKRSGVFYPLQTFSKGVTPDWNTIPICIDANNPADLHSLQDLGKKCSHKVVRISDEQRAILHVAAVFANNFTNHMLHLSWLITQRNDLDFDILKPLIRETIRKIEDNDPGKMQTGPALRGDDKTLSAHMELLSGLPEIKKVYEMLSDSIQQQKKPS